MRKDTGEALREDYRNVSADKAGKAAADRIRTHWKALRASGKEAEGSGTDGARDALGIPDGSARTSFYLS